MKRYLPLDILRGLSIFGMVLTAIAPYGVFPNWMYHIQNPPPTHRLDMTISGLSWVDLIFPVFLFCMGVAIPLAGRRKALPPAAYLRSTLGRFCLLWLFSYLYVLLDFTGTAGFWPNAATLAGFGAMFLIYGNFKKISRRKRQLLHGIGLLLAGLLIGIGHRYFGEAVNLQRRGIIIFLLAFLYLFASLIWYFTRERPRLRTAIWAGLLLMTAATQFFGLPAKAYADPGLRWWFNFEYFYFLLLVLPATRLGDIIYRNSMSGFHHVRFTAGTRIGAAVATGLFLVYCLTAYYYNGNPYGPLRKALPLAAALLFTVLAVLLQSRWYNSWIILAAALFTLGILAEPFDGGIRKVPCTISYCFITGSLSVLLLLFIELLDGLWTRKDGSRIPSPARWLLKGAGENPLMSYIAFGNFILPLLYTTGLIPLYQACYPEGMPCAGLVRAGVTVTVTLALVSVLSSKKIYWKA